MMEESSRSARFLFTTHTPLASSRRCAVERNTFECLHLRDSKLNSAGTHRLFENLEPASGVLGDIAHVANGNLRKSMFTMQLLAQRNLLNDRKNVQILMANSSRRKCNWYLKRLFGAESTNGNGSAKVRKTPRPQRRYGRSGSDDVNTRP